MKTAAHRILAAAGTRPRPAHWLETLLLAVLFAAIAWPVALDGGLVSRQPLQLSLSLVPLALRILLLPALAEEIIFRVLPNRHPTESGSGFGQAAPLSLLAFVAAHPLLALVTGSAAAFLTPQFLLLAALLGLACLVAYQRSGSLWPPVALHWLVVFAWLGLGGNGVLPAI